ncbi:MAG: hypothetical protein LBC41_05030, partial [Clostridiales bacterium]|nr:hypothetical protein [Clostridiales bacterium]
MAKNGRLFLGLDGGGTKTHCVALEVDSGELSFSAGGSTNYENLPQGLHELPRAIRKAVAPALEKFSAKPWDVKYSVFGMAGVDTELQRELIAEMLEEEGFGPFKLVNDAYLGVKAGSLGHGVCCVNGTGYSVAGINAKGEMLQIGGFGDLSGDLGGAGYLVPAAVRAAYTELFKRGRKTLITDGFKDWLGISDRSEFGQALTEKLLESSKSVWVSASRIL